MIPCNRAWNYPGPFSTPSLSAKVLWNVFLSKIKGPISSTETLNTAEINDSGASTVKSSSSSTCSSPTPIDHIYDDCPYDTGIY